MWGGVLGSLGRDVELRLRISSSGCGRWVGRVGGRGRCRGVQGSFGVVCKLYQGFLVFGLGIQEDERGLGFGRVVVELGVLNGRGFVGGRGWVLVVQLVYSWFRVISQYFLFVYYFLMLYGFRFVMSGQLSRRDFLRGQGLLIFFMGIVLFWILEVVFFYSLQFLFLGRTYVC